MWGRTGTEHKRKDASAARRIPPRIDILIRANYRNLHGGEESGSVARNKSSGADQELTRQKAADGGRGSSGRAERKNIAKDGGRAPHAPMSAPMPDKPEPTEEPAGQKSRPSTAQNPGQKRPGGEDHRRGCFLRTAAPVELSPPCIRTASDRRASRACAGYSGMIVLTESMQSGNAPRSSLGDRLRTVEPGNPCQIGDSITYMASQTTSVTQRIVGDSSKNYENTGRRAFPRRRGIARMNDQPDVP
ncbi:MAG: hypothetical protein ACLR23_14670 [Clostridia bacterium]